jgi:hypothetical protein
MTGQRKPVNSARDIFLMPLLIGIISTAGLASALLGDGIWDAVSWFTLGFPVAIAGFFLCKVQRRPR